MHDDDKPGPLDWVTQAFWIADVMVLAMLAFFIVLSGRSGGTVFTGILIAMAAAYAAYALVRQRQQGATQLSRVSRRTRERRGF